MRFLVAILPKAQKEDFLLEEFNSRELCLCLCTIEKETMPKKEIFPRRSIHSREKPNANNQHKPKHAIYRGKFPECYEISSSNIYNVPRGTTPVGVSLPSALSAEVTSAVTLMPICSHPRRPSVISSPK